MKLFQLLHLRTLEPDYMLHYKKLMKPYFSKVCFLNVKKECVKSIMFCKLPSWGADEGTL